VEREHELERMAAGIPNSPAKAENSQRIALMSAQICLKSGAAAAE
jgi:hypothetical protein